MLHVGVALQDDPVDARLQLLLSQICYALVDPAEETGQGLRAGAMIKRVLGTYAVYIVSHNHQHGFVVLSSFIMQNGARQFGV
jgi:hypothetical protein